MLDVHYKDCRVKVKGVVVAKKGKQAACSPCPSLN